MHFILSVSFIVWLTLLIRSCKKCKGARTVKEKKRVEFYLERGMHFGETIVIKDEGDESVRRTSLVP